MIKNEKKYMFWILGIFLIWIIISAFWYTCGLKGFCEDKNIVKVKKDIKVLVEEDEYKEYKEEDDNVFIKINDLQKGEEKIEIKNFEKRTITCLTHINSTMEINSSKNINSEVKKLEIFFNSYFKKNLVVDGYFGLEEKEAVIEFQENKNLDNDGVVGPKTLEVINAVYCVKNENKN